MYLYLIFYIIIKMIANFKTFPRSVIINTTTKIKFLNYKNKITNFKPEKKITKKNVKNISKIGNIPKYLPDYDEKYIQQIIRNGGL